jgi:uncharacterized protein YecA (UPF0149 family)
MIRKTRARHLPIDDVAEATAWWDRREKVEDDEDDLMLNERDDGGDPADQFTAIAEPYRAPAKVGRNEPCPCGSGKKYKKCCGR